MNWRNWLDPDWRNAHKLFSMQVTFFWTVVTALYMALPAFTALVSPWTFLGLCIFFGVLIMVARMTNQPGV